jgi:hypothetical protein
MTLFCKAHFSFSTHVRTRQILTRENNKVNYFKIVILLFFLLIYTSRRVNGRFLQRLFQHFFRLACPDILLLWYSPVSSRCRLWSWCRLLPRCTRHSPYLYSPCSKKIYFINHHQRIKQKIPCLIKQLYQQCIPVVLNLFELLAH